MQKQFEKHIALKKKQQNEINKVLNQYKQYKNITKITLIYV